MPERKSAAATLHMTASSTSAEAALAPAAGLDLLPFLIVTVPARLARFLLLTAGARWLARRLLPRSSETRRLVVLLLAWAVFYAAYFAFAPS